MNNECLIGKIVIYLGNTIEISNRLFIINNEYIHKDYNDKNIKKYNCIPFASFTNTLDQNKQYTFKRLDFYVVRDQNKFLDNIRKVYKNIMSNYDDISKMYNSLYHWYLVNKSNSLFNMKLKINPCLDHYKGLDILILNDIEKTYNECILNKYYNKIYFKKENAFNLVNNLFYIRDIKNFDTKIVLEINYVLFKKLGDCDYEINDHIESCEYNNINEMKNELNLYNSIKIEDDELIKIIKLIEKIHSSL